MALSVPGLIMMVFFYVFVLAIGIWASLKSKKMKEGLNSGQVEISFLADRSVGLLVGVFTMSATWVGGAFIIGIAETVYDPSKGLIWALIPVQMSVAFLIGGLVFAKPMREQNYITMMDPFQRKYGKKLTGFLAIIPFVSEMIWVPPTLISLGVTVSILSDLSLSLSIWISAAVAIIYTVLGGLYSVAFTDVVQLSLVFGSLSLCAPFVLASDVYTDLSETAFNHTHRASWLGEIKNDDMWIWIDTFLVMSIGNLGFQGFHQRTLSSKSTSTARLICFIAAGVVLVLGIPPVLIGRSRSLHNWNSTSYGLPSPYDRGESAKVLPIILLHLTPTAVFVIGMGAIAGAAMSSTDSYLLAATSIFTTNIYQLIRPQASDKELQWVIRVSIVVVGVVGTSLSYLDNSVLAFWILGSDLTYTIILPQLICILFIKISNGYGAIAGYIIGFVMRVLCGEPVFNLPVVLHLPGCTLVDDVYVQRSPFKTICMLCSLVSIVFFSYAALVLFEKEILPERWDVFKVKSQRAETPAEGAKEHNDGKGDVKTESDPMLETRC